MKKTNGWLLATVMLLISTLTYAQTEQEQRIRTSYLLAFGRDASGGEVTYWKGQGNRSVGDLYNNHKAYIKSDNNTRRQAIIQSYVDALGYNPTEAEISYHSQFNRTYTEMMNEHMKYVSANAGEYNKVIRRSYQKVFGRPATDGEVAYWSGQAKSSYLMLISYHDTWKKANTAAAPAKGASTTAGLQINFTNPAFGVGLSVSSLVATEARNAVGMVAAGGGNMVAAGGGNMVAAGGGNMVAAGGGNMVAAGGGN
jgi:hypothetical protein